MILTAFLRALAQLPDRRFRRVLGLGLALTLALLVAVYALVLWAIQALTGDTVTLPLIGPVGGLDTLLSLGSALLMLGLSVVLMVPVASAFLGLFLEDVAQAVEDRYYPGLPPAPRQPLGDVLIDTVNAFGLGVAVNVLAVGTLVVAPPVAPLVFWGLNGLVLGREYFTLAAMRRLGRDGARRLRARHRGRIWLAGTLMAAPLSVPVVNLLVPLLGAATFTHLFHRLHSADPSAPPSRNRAR